ncbi:MAG: hypothetical protein JO036_06710 [Candidatus Eremiobacteraeota bacterium]|nr:hypothetical protein [Candidatus Eremiobacteraeota bacterium]
MNERKDADREDAESLNACERDASDESDEIETLWKRGAFAAPPKMKTTRVYYN